MKVVSGNCQDGFGKVIWPNGKPFGPCPGITYEGYFKKGIPNGFGKFYYPCTGCIYFGEVRNGKENGIGTLRWPKGHGYTGQFKDGEPSGKGISWSDDGRQRITEKWDKIGLSLLPSGELEREDIYSLSPTLDSNSPFGVYIPMDLADCHQELEKMLMPELIQKMRIESEADMVNYHFGLGLWIRSNWDLWGGSSLAKWFNDQGIAHPDNMSGIILDSFWRHLQNAPMQIDDLIKKYKENAKNSQ
jgi:hypothetical protein